MAHSPVRIRRPPRLLNPREHAPQNDSKARSRLRAIAILFVLILCGAVLAHVSLTMHPRFLTMGDSIGSQKAIYDRSPAYFGGQLDEFDMRDWRNRVMLPYLMEGFSHFSGMEFGRTYVFFRWVTATLAVAAFMGLSMRTLALDAMSAVATAALFALSLIPTFTHIYEIPSDFLDAAFFCALTAAALARNRLAFSCLLLIGLLNRESAVFATLVWFSLHAFGHGPRNFWRESAWCGLCGIVSTAIVVSLRVANSVHGASGAHPTFWSENIRLLGQGSGASEPASFWSANISLLRDFIARPRFGHPYFFLGGYLAFMAFLLASEWGSIGWRARRLVLAAAAIFVVSSISHNLDELRIFIPSLVLSMLVVFSIAWRREVGGSQSGAGTDS